MTTLARPSRVTLHHVAARAGVSIATVSRALNGLPVAPENQQRVEQAAAELGYVPNEAARSLRSDRTLTLGLIFFQLGPNRGVDLLDELGATVEQGGYSLLISTARGDPNNYSVLMRRFLERRVDGLFCSAPARRPGPGAALPGRQRAGPGPDLRRAGVPQTCRSCAELRFRHRPGRPAAAARGPPQGRLDRRRRTAHAPRPPWAWPGSRARSSPRSFPCPRPAAWTWSYAISSPPRPADGDRRARTPRLGLPRRLPHHRRQRPRRLQRHGDHQRRERAAGRAPGHGLDDDRIRPSSAARPAS